MAKKQITPSSSPTEIRIANEQLARAQQEYKQTINQKYAGKDVTLATLDREAQSIAAKYDYVDYGQLPPPPSVKLEPGELYIGGSGFFVKGIGNDTKVTFSPESKTTVNQDDAAIPSNTGTSVTSNPNPQGVNPKAAKTDQNTAIESAPVTATQSQQVQPETALASGTNTGAKESEQIGAAIESQNKNQSTQNQTGIVNENVNQLPTTNNLPGRLSDEFLREPAISDGRKKGSSDDEGSIARPMGTAIGSFVNIDELINSPDPARTGNNSGVTIGTTNSIPIPTNSSPGTKNKPGITERPNILHEYANWTYKLAWYMVDNNTYNTIVSSGNVPGNVGRLIAKSGGVGAQQSQEMAGDVYFRNLRFTSVIGNRQAGAATNNVELEMTIVEPYGASLIGELAAMAVNMTGENSISPAEVAYLLEIDFAGYKDDGTIVPSILQNGKKYIPVKILSIEMSLQASGTVYTIAMAPYSLYANSQRYADMEFGIKLKGKVVSDMLSNQPGGLMAQLNAWEDLKTRESKIASIPDQYAIELYSFNTKGSRDQAMANSPFAYPQVGGVSTILKTRDFETNNVGETTYTIPKGSIIKDVIKNIILHSQYFNERVDPKNPNDLTKVAELIKIIPVIEILPTYDTARNEFAKKITYKVFNTLNFGEIRPGVGNAPVSDWGYGKIYNWLFTGKNADIIDANLVFNMIYFTKMESNIQEQNTTKLGQTADGLREWADQSQFKKGIATKGGGVSSSGSNVPERYINATVAAEWFDSKMASSNADNVVLDLKIIGDPDWIPQDGSIRGGPIEVGTDLVDRHGSIAVDVAGVYVKLNLRTPRDYNPTTGLMDLKADQLTIQGVYQVITVESMFEDGRFTQTLNMVKVPNQEEEKAQNSSAGIFSSNNPADRQLTGSAPPTAQGNNAAVNIIGNPTLPFAR